jgi:hypothetical protein
VRAPNIGDSQGTLDAPHPRAGTENHFKIVVVFKIAMKTISKNSAFHGKDKIL